MSTLVDCTIATEEFSLGQAFQDCDYERVELDRTVQLATGLVPYLWVYGNEPEIVQECLLADERVTAVTVLDEIDGAALIRVEWAPEIDGLLELISARDAELVDATGRSDRWTLRLRLHSPGEGSAFQQACREKGLSLDITAVHDLSEEDAGPDAQVGARGGTELARGGTELTPAQREVLTVAIENGYFDIPRRTTAAELGEQLGISDAAVSERLRRATKKMGAEAVSAEPDRPARDRSPPGGPDSSLSP